MTSIIASFKNYLAKRARNKLDSAALAQAMSVINNAKTDTGYALPFEQVFQLDYAGEFRRIYRVGDFIIDTFHGFLGDLIIVGRIEDGANEKGLMDLDNNLTVLAYTRRDFLSVAETRINDLIRRNEYLIPLASLLSQATQNQPAQ